MNETTRGSPLRDRDPARAVPGDGRRLPHCPALDGLRGVAVVGVLLFHAGFNLAGTAGASDVPGGFLGVSTFFTLSGFLITSLLLAEHRATGRIDLRAFWTRRFRRLMPAALAGLVLAVLFGAFAATPEQVAELRGDVVAALLDVANWHLVLGDTSYSDAFAAPSPVLHFWSLAIEEQFYLLFPLLVLAALTAFRRLRRPLRTFGILLAVGVAASVALASMTQFADDRVYFGTDTRASELLLGALLAVVVALRPIREPAVRRRAAPIAVGVLGTVVLVATCWLWVATDQASRWVYEGGLALYGLLTVAVIVAALTPANPVSDLLGTAPLRALGRISYGVYVYHWPVFLWVNAEAPTMGYWSQLALKLALTLGLAIASYHLLEMPVRRGEPLLRVSPARLAPVAAFVVVVAVVAVTGRSDTAEVVTGEEVAADGPVRELTADEQAIIEGGAEPANTATSRPPSSIATMAAPDRGSEAAADLAPPSHTTATTVPAGPPPTLPKRPVRIMVVGDSAAQAVGLGFARWGAETGLVSVSMYTEIGCGISRGGTRLEFVASGDHKENDVPDGCEDWSETWDFALRAQVPDIVVIGTGLWDVTERRPADGGPLQVPGVPAWNDFLESEFVAAAELLTSTGAELMWLDNPPVAWGHFLTPAVDHPANDPERMLALDRIVLSVAHHVPRVHVIPLTEQIESAPGGVFDPDMRPDGVHLDDDSALDVARVLVPQMLHIWLHAEATP